MPIMKRQALPEAGDIAAAIVGLKDYYVEVSGMGRPRNPPLPLNLGDPYYLGVICRLSSQLSSTSDLHEESGGRDNVPFYEDPCDEIPRSGFFSDPYTLQIIEVPNAGCGHFWIEFALGNSLFPRIERGSLDILDPAVVINAEQLFQSRFVQGCTWG
jgi:hypothetical protein